MTKLLLKATVLLLALCAGWGIGDIITSGVELFTADYSPSCTRCDCVIDDRGYTQVDIRIKEIEEPAHTYCVECSSWLFNTIKKQILLDTQNLKQNKTDSLHLIAI